MTFWRFLFSMSLALGITGILALEGQERPSANPAEVGFTEVPEPESESRIESVYAWVDSLGWSGFLIFIIAYILSTVAFIPGSWLTVGAGLLFGVVSGTIAVSIGSVIGAALAFLISRYLAREKIKARFGSNARFRAIDTAIGREGWKIVLLLRLTPVLPFNVSNYLYGLTAVRFWAYVFASWIGMFPGTLLYVYIGSLGKTGLEAASESTDTGKLVLNIIAFAATVAVTVYVTKIARRALRDADLDSPATVPLEGAS